MKKPIFTGACTAIITPFTEQGIDFERLKNQLIFQEDNEIEAIVVAGTTGENATLDEREFSKLVSFVIRNTSDCVKTIVCIGGNSTEECLAKAELAECFGADAILMTTPYYNKSSQNGVIQHFTHIADRSKLPLILYNVPGRTAIGIAGETYKVLSEHENINGVKEASGDISLVSEIRAKCGDMLNVWSGNDDQTIPMMALGAKGVISVASNIIPGEIVRICRECLAGNFLLATAIYQRIAEFCKVLFIEPNPIPIKAAMAICDLDSGFLRLPLIEISEAHKKLLLNEMKSIGITFEN